MKNHQIKQTTKMWKEVLKEESLVVLTFQPSRIGVFNDEEALRESLCKKGIQSIYTVLNEIKEETKKKLPVNRLSVMKTGEGISGADIRSYKYFFIDIDVVGLRQEDGKKRNATDEEHQEAFEVAKRVMKILANLEYPEPAVIDSANGYHLLYAVCGLKATKKNETLLRKCLCIIASRVDTQTCKIDTVVADRARKIKLAGSANQLESQGARYSRIVSIPETIVPVTEEQLNELASLEKGKGNTKGWKGSPSDEAVSENDIVNLMEDIGEYYCSETRQVFADIRMEDGKTNTLNIASNEFRFLVRRRMKEVLKLRLMSNEQWKDIISYLEVLGSEQREEVRIYNRIGQRNGNFYIDIQNDAYECIEISKAEVAIINTPPKLFQRLDLDKEQIEPVYDEEFDYFETIGQLFNLRTKEERILLGIVIICFFIPDIAKPLILFSGPHGSGKSTGCSIIQDIVSPQTVFRSALPRRIDDLAVRLANRCLCVFDNCEKISNDMSSLIAQCITGGSYEKRKLYTNCELVSIPIKSGLILNSCEAILEKPDILSRTIQFNLQSISGDKLMDDTSIWKKYEKVKANMLAYICFALSDYLKLPDDNPEKITYVTRMTEFQKAASKIAQVTLNVAGDYVSKLLKHNKSIIDLQVVESNPVAVLISDFMRNRSTWEGSVTELYDKLDQLAFESGIERSNKLYPKHAASLSMRLNSLVSVLENIGITFTIRPEGKYKKIYIKNNTMTKTAHRAKKACAAEEPEIEEELDWGGDE